MDRRPTSVGHLDRAEILTSCSSAACPSMISVPLQVVAASRSPEAAEKVSRHPGSRVLKTFVTFGRFFFVCLSFGFCPNL